MTSAVPNPTSAVNPSSDSIAALATWPDDDAIAMVNLLMYSGEDGRAAYGRYAEAAVGTITARGGSLIYMAPVIAPTESWNTLAIVRYPRRAAFLDMQKDPAYRAAIPDRTAGLAARLLYPFALAHDTDTDGVQASTVDRFVALDLLADGAGDADHGVTVLRLAAGGPGLVSDDPWSEMRLVAYESRRAWEADLAANTEGVLSILTRQRPSG